MSILIHKLRDPGVGDIRNRWIQRTGLFPTGFIPQRCIQVRKDPHVSVTLIPNQCSVEWAWTEYTCPPLELEEQSCPPKLHVFRWLLNNLSYCYQKSHEWMLSKNSTDVSCVSSLECLVLVGGSTIVLTVRKDFIFVYSKIRSSL